MSRAYKRFMCVCQHERLGYRIEGGVLTKAVIAERHMLRNPAGWAFQAAVVDQHKSDVHQIELRASDGRKFVVTMARFLRLCVKIERGFGPQYFLPIYMWTIIGADGVASVEQLPLL